MLVYLDQNKWIELSRIVYGKNNAPDGQSALAKVQKTLSEQRVIFPLSAIHYMEIARISNKDRRARLAKVMWQISSGYTLASYTNIVIHECEMALSKFFEKVQMSDFQLIGRGIEHAFGEKFETTFPPHINELLEQSILSGVTPDGLKGPVFFGIENRTKFTAHLNGLSKIKRELPPDKWDDALYAIATVDIIEPLKVVMLKSGISPAEIGSLGKDNLRSIVENMPSRFTDVHLHRQMLKNPNLSSKISDLEDWAGLGVYAQYCDLVICEKHFANLILRDGFKTKAEIKSDIAYLNEL